jgi:hypothetical protein
LEYGTDLKDDIGEEEIPATRNAVCNGAVHESATRRAEVSIYYAEKFSADVE